MARECGCTGITGPRAPGVEGAVEGGHGDIEGEAWTEISTGIENVTLPQDLDRGAYCAGAEFEIARGHRRRGLREPVAADGAAGPAVPGHPVQRRQEAVLQCSR